ncbi:radical SAM protein [Deltaproteobacteria bacterium TL4]
MNTLLINTSFNRYAGMKGHGGSSAPLNLACLAAYLRQQRLDAKVTILDAEAYGLSYEETLEKIAEVQPQLLGITTTTPSFDVITELIQRIKLQFPSVSVIIGGPHATGLPEESAMIPGVAAAVIGEGELTLVHLYDAIVNRTGFDSIPGICFNDKGVPHRTQNQALIQDLDKLPFPARDLLPMHLYKAPPTKALSEEASINIVSSRGCPFHCTYCLSDMMWTRKYRERSPENVIEEIQEIIQNYQAKEFNFNDDLFTANKRRLQRFCELLLEKKLPIRWICMSRADYSLDLELLRLMKKAGCEKIAMGLESGSQDVLKAMNKRLDLAKSAEAVRRIKQAGIKVGASFVLGHVGETPETLKETIKLAKRCNPDTVAFFQASPYPGTEFYRMVKEAGYLRKNLKWEDYAIVSNKISTVDLPGLPAEEIHRWVIRAYRSFYLSPRYLLTRLWNIRSLHDISNLLAGFWIFVKITATTPPRLFKDKRR